jgi:hypothetical protein
MESSQERQAHQEAEGTVTLVIDGAAQFVSGRNSLIEKMDGRFFITVRTIGEAWSTLAVVAIDAIHFPPGTAHRKEVQRFRADVGRMYPFVLLVDSI